MKVMVLAIAVILLFQSNVVTSSWIPSVSELAVRNAGVASDALIDEPISDSPVLEKRRGGGGRGGGSSGRGGGGGGGGGGRGGSSGSSSRTGNRGGTTRSGSGPRPTYGSGNYYAGGTAVPYAAGRMSPLGLTPFFLPVAALAFFPGLWLFGAYAYPYNHAYSYMNNATHHNESVPVVCLCQEYEVCGCDDNNDSKFYNSLFNGSEPINSSITRVVNVNGTEKIYINGTLPNGTTAANASATDSAASTVNPQHLLGYWPIVALASGVVWLL